MGRAIDLIGLKFGELTVEGREPCQGSPRWRCSCSCGEKKVILGQSLRRGDTKSCGHLAKKASRIRGLKRFGHGLLKDQEMISLADQDDFLGDYAAVPLGVLD